MHLDQNFLKTVLTNGTFSDVAIPADAEFSVDSRLVTPGSIFIALKGTRVDGHDFIKDALSRGAAGIIISNDRKDVIKTLGATALKKIALIQVPSPQEALLQLATAWREKFSCPIIGITGSIGKTSTKEMLANILRIQGLPFIASYGNQNTTIGMSLNILRMRSEHKVAIFEMGVSRRGEMARMAAIVRPTTGIITSIGHSHMEGLGSLADIANEKRDIFKYFKEDNIGIINGDQPVLATISYMHPIVKFGCKTTNQVQARKIQANNLNSYFMLKLYKERYKIMLDTNHAGRVINALAASAAAYLLNIPHDTIVKGVEVPLTITGRFEQAQLKAAKGILINDCYNASPESVKAALLAFEKVESKGQKIAVIGDMLELGVNSAFWHRQVGRFLRKVPSLHHVILVGDLVQWTKKTLPVGLTHEHVASWQEAVDCVKVRLDREAVILVKGSRGVGLTNLVTQLVDASL
ncbi:UDP-N-acetylmuramoyl-tripeptide--D-alanyl-D-alanine ligase [Candidatus Dependentiae bacterium]|nr:UDP-N-acetylmuramoyl-tripeptide--D-alanyl-D-alanine ligase [Candidatus Dependentiae bacterium]